MKARTVQYVLLALLVVAAVRVIVIFRSRHAAAPEKTKAAAPPLNPEAYVVPKKLYLSSLEKARKELPQQPIWAKEGYRLTYYPVSGSRVDFKHDAGTLGPIEKIQVAKVMTAPLANNPNRSIVALFEKSGRTYAVPIGTQSGADSSIYADEMFFYEDPHHLFHFWQPETWDAISRHEVKTGMNEWQVAFAVGMGTPQPGGDVSRTTVIYPNGGNPLTVTFEDGKVTGVQSSH